MVRVTGVCEGVATIEVEHFSFDYDSLALRTFQSGEGDRLKTSRPKKKKEPNCGL